MEMVPVSSSAMIGAHPDRDSRMRPDLQTIETNGIRLRVALAGAGPLVVLIHGFPESWYSWRHQIPALADAGYRVAAPDVRGYGGSDKPHPIDAYSIKNLCADIDGLIAALGAERAIVVGHDWGAPIAYWTAMFHPGRVRAVAGLSVPALGRGPMPSIQLFRNIYKDRFFYQLYFQEPGVAEAELEADVLTSLRKFYYWSSGERQIAKAGIENPTGSGLSRSPRRPKSVSGLADRGRSRLLRQPVSKQRLPRSTQSLSQLRTRFRRNCRV